MVFQRQDPTNLGFWDSPLSWALGPHCSILLFGLWGKRSFSSLNTDMVLSRSTPLVRSPDARALDKSSRVLAISTFFFFFVCVCVCVFLFCGGGGVGLSET